MNDSKVLTSLNNVIATYRDREESYQFCLERTPEDRPTLKSLLAEGRVSCELAASELQDLVRAQGGEPETSVSLAGAFHRNWLDIKTAIVGIDREQILEECDSAAESAGRACRKAMENDLSPRTRSTLQRHLEAIVRDREKISSIRDTAALT